MAKAQYFEHKAGCGHTESVEGRWSKGGYRGYSWSPISNHILCYSCYCKVQEILSKTEQSAIQEVELELPPLAQLQGTDKQVAWAGAIRGKYIEQATAQMRTLQAAMNAETDSDSLSTLIALNTILRFVLRQASGASFWIEYRDKNILPYEKLMTALDLMFSLGKIKGDSDSEQSQLQKAFGELRDLLLKTDWQIKAEQRRKRAWR